MTGAAILSSRAALACGAGLITLYHKPGLETIFEISLTEVMTKPFCPDDDTVLKKILDSHAILIGPGLGKSEWALKVLTIIIENYELRPLIIDADAINLISENQHLLDKIKGRKLTILTPHVAEFSRISNMTIEDINNNPCKSVIDFCEKHRTSVLLKNHYCFFYSDHGSMLYTFNSAFITGGNDGLSKGGSGDVLAGMIVSILIQKLLDYHRQCDEQSGFAEPNKMTYSIKSAICSTVKYLYSIAEKLSETYETRAITPSMIIENLFRKQK